jgi:predicted signal transduction protein with EAL and GGDEF domain
MVLREVASRFKAQMQPGDMLARWGGDEFVVAMPQADGLRAAQLANHLVEALQRPFSIDGGRYHISMSTGIALYPADGRTVDTLLRCADTAMYRAKAQGANQYRFYESTMNAGVERFLKIDNALRHELERGGDHLSLAFQPQYSADGLRILGVEALLRWNHPELGQVSPGQFIPVAEDTGQILALGRWVIHAAARAQAHLLGRGVSVPMSINVSAVQLRDDTLAACLQEASDQWGIATWQMLIEVTESAIMTDEAKVMKTLQEIRALGFKISIDDFGTVSATSFL